MNSPCKCIICWCHESYSLVVRIVLDVKACAERVSKDQRRKVSGIKTPYNLRITVSAISSYIIIAVKRVGIISNLERERRNICNTVARESSPSSIWIRHPSSAVDDTLICCIIIARHQNTRCARINHSR